MRCERCAIIRTLLVLMPAQSCYYWNMKQFDAEPQTKAMNPLSPMNSTSARHYVMSTTYLLVSHAGEIVTRHATASAAVARGAMLDRCVAASTGGRGGMDCHVVVDRDGELSYRGMVCGRRIIGRGFGCGPAVVEQARAKLPAAVLRAPDRISGAA